MRLLFMLLGGLLLSAGVNACGGTGGATGASVPRKTTSAAGGPSSAATSNPSSAVARVSSVQATGRYLNDGDHDRIGDEDGDNNGDFDNDAPWDYKHERNDNGDYHDRDDSATLRFGHAAGTATKRVVTALVKRYYEAAGAGDGRRACSMLLPSLARAVPVDWGGAYAPEYLRGQKTCEAVMRLLFRHSGSSLSAPVTVTGVRINGDSAFALVGSASMPARYLVVQRHHGAWVVISLLGDVLR